MTAVEAFLLGMLAADLAAELRSLYHRARGDPMAKQFTTTAKRREVIEFNLDDDAFHFTPRKVATVMMPVLDHEEHEADDDDESGGGKLSMTQRTWDWLKAGLADGEYDVIRQRLEDPDDDLDVPDVAEVVKWLMGKVAGRPTGSRRG